MIKTGLVDVTRQVERQIVDAFDLTEVEIESDLACRTGTFRQASVRIESRQYRGDRIRLARFAVVQGETLEIGNVLCIPQPAYVTPILGADLVAARANSVMVAADLSPVSGIWSDHRDDFDELKRARKEAPDVPSGGELPAWAQDLFSPHALYTRVELAQAPDAYRAFQVFPDVFIRRLASAEPDPSRVPDTSRSQEHYSDVHRDDDKGLRLLGAMFGMEWAERYLRHFLFPEADRF